MRLCGPPAATGIQGRVPSQVATTTLGLCSGCAPDPGAPSLMPSWPLSTCTSSILAAKTPPPLYQTCVPHRDVPEPSV